MAAKNKDNSFMSKIAEFIVERRAVFLLLFIALIIFSLFSMGWVEVEEDITVYLSDSAEAKQGLELMNREFESFASARVMVEGIERADADKLKARLEAIDGVAMVGFDGTDDSYLEQSALYSISFSGAAEDEQTLAAMAEVKSEISRYDNYVNSAVGNNLSDVIAKEMQSVVILVAIVVVTVAIFTSSTYGEVLVLLGTFLAAAIINKGTNFMMGKISFVTDSVAIVLQLALSVDYAIIFCNRYKEEHESYDIIPAVKRALRFSIPEISASSLTTIAGLTAMTFMEFRLGADLGFGLIKAIVCSLLAVFLFMPALLVLLGPLMDKTKHKSFVPKIPFVGKFAYATRKVIPILFIFVVIGAYLVFGNCNYSYAQDNVQMYKQSENDAAASAINARFGTGNQIAVLVPAGDYEKEAELLKALSALGEVESATGLASIEALDGYKLSDSITYKEFAELAGTPELLSQALFAYYAADQGTHRDIISWGLDDYEAPLLEVFLFLHDKAENGDLPIEAEQMQMIDELYSQLDFAQRQLQGENYSRMLLVTNLPTQHEDSFAFIDKVHIIAAQYYPEGVLLTGESVSAYDFSSSFEKDNMIVSIMSIVLVMLILLFTFKSAGMPLLLIMVIQGSIWLNFSIPTIQGKYVFFMCYLIVSAIQMGANIDYAIVISSRYTDSRRTMDRKEAIIETMNLAFPTIITSGTMIVIAGLLIAFLVSQPIVAGIGRYVGIGSVITLVLVLFVLPQVLLFGDGFIRATSFRLGRKERPVNSRAHGGRLPAYVLAIAALFALIALPLSYRAAKAEAETVLSDNTALLDTTLGIAELAGEIDMSQARYDSTKLSFAEHYVTQEQGEEQLIDGQAEYDAGAAELSEGQLAYNAAAAQIADAKAQYDAGRQRIAAAQAEYDAGAAELAAGKALYAENEQRLINGQAAYDAGAAEMEAARAEYAAGEEQLKRIEPVYNLIMPLYNGYQDLQAQYDEAIAAGDTVRAALIRPTLELAKYAFSNELAGTGYSLEGIIAEYDAGQAKLAAAAIEIAEAQAVLDAASAELEAGYAELAAAKAKIDEAQSVLNAASAELEAGYAELERAAAQIADGERRLAAAWAELNAGYTELFSAGAQLEEGKALLDENKQKMQEELLTLDRYRADDERVNAAIDALMTQPEVAARVGLFASYSQICSSARMYFEGELDTASGELLWARRACLILVLAALLALAAVILRLVGRGGRLPVFLGGLAALLAIAAAIILQMACSYMGIIAFAAAIILAVCAVVCTDIIAGQIKAEKATVSE